MTLAPTPAGVPSRPRSSLVYGPEAPDAVSAPAREALAPFAPLWSTHPEHGGWPGVLLRRAHWFEAIRALKERAGFDMLTDHTAVDYPARRPERFTVVAIVTNLATQERLIVKTRVAEGDSVPSLVPLWKSADWAERETYDMFGIPFEGHPELTRIYMPQDFDGWPLRRDFPMQGHLRFKD
jgi:NADH-quinone oxidoreductase subunit C